MSASAFLSELKRRRVFRVAAAYVVVAFALLQAADIIFPALGLPPWIMTLVVVVAFLGFPMAVALAWAFDITPEGVVRTDAQDAQPRVQPSTSTEPYQAGARSPSRAGRLAVAGAVVILAGAGFAFALAGGRGEASDLSPSRVVVDAFVNRTGDPALDAAGHMAADWLVDGLQQLEDLEVVPAQSPGIPAVAAAAPGAEAGADRIALLASSTGAGLVVTGTYYLEGDVLRFRAEITNARRGRLLHTTHPVAAPRTSPSAALEPLRQEVMGYLATQMEFRQSDQFDRGSQVSARPPSYEAYRHFRTGHELFLQGDIRAALPHLNNAIARDSSFGHAVLVTAIAHMSLGEHEESESYVALLERQRESLSPSGRAWTDYMRAVFAGDRTRTLSAMRRAVEASPYPFSLYQLGLEATRANRPREAIHVFGQIRSESYLAAWQQHWIRLSEANHLLGEHARELEVVREGLTHFANNLWLRSSELQALAALGGTQEVLARLDELFTLRGDLATALHSVALELAAHGHADAATQVLERSVAWQRSRPASEASTPEARFRLARDLLELRQTAEARRLFEVLVREAPENLTYRAYAGLAAARAGDRVATEEAMSWLATLERPYLFGAHLYQQAQIAAELGERERAVALLRDAFARGRAFGVDVHRSPHFRSLRGYPPFEEMLRPKG